MKKRTFSVTLIVVGIGLSVSMPARAQIASQVDESGKLVFVNSEPAAHPPRKPVPPGFHFSKQGELANTETGTIVETVPPERLDRIVRDGDRASEIVRRIRALAKKTDTKWRRSSLMRS